MKIKKIVLSFIAAALAACTSISSISASAAQIDDGIVSLGVITDAGVNIEDDRTQTLGPIRQALIDINDWIYLHCGSFDTLIYLMPLIVCAGVIYWVTRALIQKRKLGDHYRVVRKEIRLNEMIRTLLVCWLVFIICSMFTGAGFWGYFWKCMVHGLNPFDEMWQFGRYEINLVPRLLHYILIGHLDWLMSSARSTYAHWALNFVLYLPLGLALPLVYKKATLLKVTLVGFSISFTTEIIQIFIGRNCDIDDLLLNVLGAVSGYLFYKLMKKLFPKFIAKCKRSVNDAFSEISNSYDKP